MLLEEGKSPVNATDNDGLTALHHAISEGHGDAAILLLKSGAEAEKRDGDGRLAIELVPDDKVSLFSMFICDLTFFFCFRVGFLVSLSDTLSSQSPGQAVHFAGGRERGN
jgi:hypothetical protein